VQKVHATGEMYSAVGADLQRYVHKNLGLGEYLDRLLQSGKELFMVTNSPYSFMNMYMCLMLEEGWRKMFKYVVVLARKPTFFQSASPFRLYDVESGRLREGGRAGAEQQVRSI